MKILAFLHALFYKFEYRAATMQSSIPVSEDVVEVMIMHRHVYMRIYILIGMRICRSRPEYAVDGAVGRN